MTPLLSLSKTLSLTYIYATLLSLLLTTLTTQSHPATSPPTPTTTTISVKDYNATGDGKHYDTHHIQSAIDACPSPNPCHVIFPSGGTYLIATIHLKSGVVLVIEDGATILGGTNIKDYDAKDSWKWYVVVGEQVDNVGITGGGEINGQSSAFVERFDERKNVMVSWNQTGACLGDECRPRLVGFVGCRNVTVNHVRLVQPAYWWNTK